MIHYKQKPKRIITPLIIKEADDMPKLYDGTSMPVKVNALWDTGADCCAISLKLAEQLHLTNAGNYDVSGFGGDKNSPTYYVDLILPRETRA
jgi:hypothetical protein